MNSLSSPRFSQPASAENINIHAGLIHNIDPVSPYANAWDFAAVVEGKPRDVGTSHVENDDWVEEQESKIGL
jgi:hypothetical protein